MKILCCVSIAHLIMVPFMFLAFFQLACSVSWSFYVVLKCVCVYFYAFSSGLGVIKLLQFPFIQQVLFTVNFLYLLQCRFSIL